MSRFLVEKGEIEVLQHPHEKLRAKGGEKGHMEQWRREKEKKFLNPMHSLQIQSMEALEFGSEELMRLVQ